jgi:SpoVK/Ycf46/Vps4 family AAA+-type ATPase
MSEKTMLRQLLPLLHSLCPGSSGAAKSVLAWIEEHRGHLWPHLPQTKKFWKKGWDALPALSGELGDDGGEPSLLATAQAVARLLALDPFDAALLRAAVALQRLPRIAALRLRLVQADADLLLLAGILAGEEPSAAAGRVRRSSPVLLGLLEIEVSRSGQIDLDLSWRFDRLLDRGVTDEDQLTEALAGIRQEPSLPPEAFADQREPFGFLRRLLTGALADKAEGVNILIHGPPGTGKTEFARTLAGTAGARLYAVGEADEDGEEPTRFDRLHALKRAHRLLARRTDSVLLFDEMEDLLAPPSTGASQNRAGSKLFVNRLLEANPVPTIWTSNSLDEVDPAHMRRMSYVLAMKHPSARSRARIVARIAAEAAMPYAAVELQPLVAGEAASGSIARAAIRSAILAGGEAEDVPVVARSLLAGLRGGGDLPAMRSAAPLDLDLFESDPAIPDLVARIAAPGAPTDMSLLLAGPPGTGKTALAAHLADRLDRPLLVKRTSDLLSKWVGGTEANIAAAFAEARADGAVLLFDEADSLLLDRADARHSWERTQVNELLTWMDEHPLPFIAATNHPHRLDPAAMRRFVFKLSLDALGPERSALAWTRFFAPDPPPVLAQIAGLTPGDFAVVARQLRFTSAAEPSMILRLLEAEVRAKPAAFGQIGF